VSVLASSSGLAAAGPPLFWALLGVTLVVAAADWWAVATDRRRVEYVLKPLTMVALIGAALALSDPASAAARWWLVAGLVCSLAGDVFLMLDDLFVPGLASFLLGHIAYVVALWNLGVSTVPFVVGLAVVAVLVWVIGLRIVRGAAAEDRRLAGPVALYIAAISVMVASAIGTLVPAAIIGALLFYASDACIGWSKFLKEFRGQRLWIMTTYHLGQVGLVLALAGT
jgi:uncharacterized membrane protein YhhN